MNNEQQQATAEIPDAILEQAAIWQARLRDCDLQSAAGRQLKAEHSAWLLLNPQHQQAYAEMSALWQTLAEPVRQLPIAAAASGAPPATVSKTAPRRWTHFAAAACLVICVLGGFGWQQQWPLRWQSDYLSGTGQQTPVQLADASQIKLNSDSAIAVDFTDTERRVRLLKGEAWFDVAKDTNRPFVVATAQGTITVTGTQFNVKLAASHTEVSLVEGGVRLTANQVAATQPQVLSAGQQALLSAEGISEANLFDQTAVTAWLRDQFVFYNTPLSEVVAMLNRHRKGKIVITNKALNQLQVSGVFSTRDPDGALALILDTLPVQQTRLTDYLVLLR